MGIRDRFFTPTTAKALLSWRILVGVGVGAAMAIAGLPVGVAIAVGAGVYVAAVAAAMPQGPQRANIDPFVLSEPWRQLMQQAQGSGRKLRATVADAGNGPLGQTLHTIADQLEHGLDEAWEIAKRGDDIDDAVRRLDPTALRARRASLIDGSGSDPTPEQQAAIESVERQLATADRLKTLSADTASSLRLTQVQLDELVARASEVLLGSVDTAAYQREVDEVVIALEALHQAVEETRTA